MKYCCIRQHDQKDCGAACVATIAKDYGIKKSLAFFRNITKTDINGTNVFGLVEALTHLGFEVQAFQTSIDELITIEKSMFPMIARIINDDGQYHFVVINNIKNNTVYVSDPAKGKYKVTIHSFEHRFTGYIIAQVGEAKVKKEKEKSKTKQLFLQLIKCNKIIILLICITSVILTFSGIVFSLLIRYEFETLENKEQLEYEKITFDLEELYEIHEEGKLSEDEYLYYYYLIENVNWIKDNFFIVILFLIGAVLIQSIFHFVKQKLYIKLVSKFEGSIISNVTEKILHLPLDHLERWNSGELMMRYNDADTVANSIINVSISLILDVAMTIWGGILLYNENNVLFAIISLLMIFYVFIVLAYIKPIKTVTLKELEATTRQSSTIKEIVDSIYDIKYCGAEKYNYNKVLDIINKRIIAYKQARGIDVRQQTLITFVSGVCNTLFLIASFYMIMSGKMMIATYISFMALADFFINPIEDLVALQGSIQNGIVSLNRLADVLDDETNKTIPSDNTISVKDEIRLDCITYRYGYRMPVIEEFSATIPAKKHTIIEGNNGSGKSTLAKILTGMYDIESGNIYIDGINIKNISKNALINQVIYVSQNSSLLSISIRDNIILGLDCEENEFNTVLDILEIKNFSDNLPNGVDTILEENARDLSSGQIQRITIARALIRKPKILILDEATSNIDIDSEAKIINRIKTHYQSMTIISISHRSNPHILVDNVINM